MKGFSLEAARAHAAKHHYDPKEVVLDHARNPVSVQPQMKPPTGKALPKPVKMTRPEREYGLILEAMKRRSEIVDYRFQGLSLAWGADPDTGILMRYKCDWLVIDKTSSAAVGDSLNGPWTLVRVVEVKGKHIFPQDMIRFKGCRAEWPMFAFEMLQLSGGEWRRVA